jgi:predicted ATPase
MYIKRLHIQNVKSITDFQVEFENPAGWHVLIGDNGAGKSTIIKCIALAMMDSADARGIVDEDFSLWVRHGQKEGTVDVDYLIDDYDEFANGRSLRSSFAQKVQSIHFSFDSEESPSRALFYPHEHFGKDRRKGYFSISFGPYRRFENGSGEYASVSQTKPRLAPHLSAFKSSATFPHTLEWVRQIYTESLEDKSNDKLEKLKALVNSPGFLPNGYQLSEVSSKGIFFSDGNQNKVSLSALSDGYRSVLSIALELVHQLERSFGANIVFGGLDVNEPRIDLPGIVLIDEVDIHLHPSWQAKIGEWFLKFFPNMQFIVTTHSPLVCRAAAKGSIMRLVAPNSEEVSGEVSDLEELKLTQGNILEAYGTELFGREAVTSKTGEGGRKRLGELNRLAAFGKITEAEEKERQNLKKTFTTNDPYQ